MISKDKRRSRLDADRTADRPARHRTASFSIPVAAAIAACGAPGSDADERGPAETATQTQTILNGTEATPEQFTLPGDRRGWSTVRVYNRSFVGCPGTTFGWTIGTGILLENHIVLTNAHVVAAPQGCERDLTAPWSPAVTGNIFVYSADTLKSTATPTNCPAGACAQPMASGGIVMNPNNANNDDTALIFLNTRLKGIGGLTFGHFVPIFPFDEGRYVTEGVWCGGYGISSCADAPIGATEGVLRFGLSQVLESPVGGTETGFTLWPVDGNIKLPDAGDSGAPCWSSPVDGETYPLSVLGVVSGASPICGTTAFAESPPTFRHWARTEIASPTRKPPSTNSFTSSADLTWWGAYNPPGTTTNWTIASGWLSETGNVGGGTASFPDGAMRFSVVDIHENADLSVKVRTWDNDGAGIVFRYVDAQNYYFFFVRPEAHVARFYKRSAGVFTRLSEGSTSVAWSNTSSTTLKVELRDATFRGYINGALVTTATDGHIPMGYVGVYKWYLEAARFDDFAIVPKPPTANADWPIN